MVISLRSASMFFLLGMSIIVSCLGMLSVWLILYFFGAMGVHVLMFLRSIKMTNDPRYRIRAIRKIPLNKNYI